MSEHEQADAYLSAIGPFEKHLRRSKDAMTLELDTEDRRTIGIDDPVVFADLRRSLEVTNRKIGSGEIQIDQITKYAS